jgi:P-type Cu+ transporter
MDVLVALGTSAAYFYSVVEGVRLLLTPGYNPQLYFETSASVDQVAMVSTTLQHLQPLI